jgi:hypothetical protein
VAGELWCKRTGALAKFGDFGGFLECLELDRTLHQELGTLVLELRMQNLLWCMAQK